MNLIVYILNDWLQGAETFVTTLKLLSYSRIAQHFTEPKDSLLRSQELSTGTY